MNEYSGFERNGIESLFGQNQWKKWIYEAYRPLQVESEGGLPNGQTIGSFLWKTFPCSLGYSTRLTDFHLRFESHMIKLVFWIIFFNSFFCMNDSIEYCWLYWMKKKWMNILDMVLNWLSNWIFFWPHTMIKWIFNIFKMDRPELWQGGSTLTSKTAEN